ncbi:hypothetical protein [Xenophilus sp.]|uniref:hypothetical protein n=1 Tax=Xenophilus sp. TaxID=1873499 RepID=UPI0037DCF293
MRWPDASWSTRCFANTFAHRVLHKALFALVMALCLAATLAGGREAGPSSSAPTAHEWPREWDGAPLRPLALSAVEARFARQFPGDIARMTDERHLFVLRHVVRPTRMLHPAADCYRALGWRIERTRLERDEQARLWRCFHARRDASGALRVCERIEDAAGQAFTDTSAWYWAGVGGRSTGPWQAVTVVTPL